MKTIRIAMLTVAVVAGTSAVASAQASPTPSQQGGVAAGRGRGMSPTAGIELTEEQKTKLAEITKKYQPEMQAVRESMQSGGDRAESMTKMMALRDKSNADIRAVLTANQQVVFDKNMAEA